MITSETLARPSRLILRVIENLERTGKHEFLGSHIQINRWKTTHALEEYKRTLLSTTARTEAEPPSATMIESARISWRSEPALIGAKIRQRHVGKVHPWARQMIDSWIRAGKPYPSSGAIYDTRPNKSYERVAALSQQEELRDSILLLNAQDEMLRFFDLYLPRRYELSRQMLSNLQSGVDKEAFSRGNEDAGTGLHIRGRRLRRSDLYEVRQELDFLLEYAFDMGVAFAAAQIAKLEPGNVWMISVHDSRVRGAIAARSDMEVLDVQFDGEFLTVEGVAQTRQAGSDATGALANAVTERKLMRSSVTEDVLRTFKHDKVQYPFTDKELLLQIWDADAKPFANRRYVVGNDMGLMTPVKSPADALFSRAFLMIGGKKVLSEMVSGSSWTQAVYAIFHNIFASRLPADDKMMCLGDDMNLLTASASESVFDPYIKVKSTDSARNLKKILGMYTAFSVQPDPSGDARATIGVVPRVLKTVSSATKRGSRWGEQLSNLPPKGELFLQQDPATMELMIKDKDILAPYLHWTGRRGDLGAFLRSRWSSIPAEEWATLLRHMEELEHRIVPTMEEEEFADDAE